MRRRRDVSKSELVVQKDEYAYAHHPASFFERSTTENFDLPGYRWRLRTATTELLPGVTVLRSDGKRRATSRAGRAARVGAVILSGPRATGTTRRQGARARVV